MSLHAKIDWNFTSILTVMHLITLEGGGGGPLAPLDPTLGGLAVCLPT